LADNRRTSTRHAVSIAAKLAVDGAPRQVTIMNLSLGGALLGAAGKAPMGARVHITFNVPTVDEAIDVGGTVRWADDTAMGLQFDGLRARDVWALNKYFEQLTG
jgi:hypothetical protein